jgi:hypothetical protein
MMLTTVPTNHPRLFLAADDWEKIRAKTKTDKASARIAKCLEAKAAQFLAAPELTYQLDGIRLLAKSRLCIEYVLTLAMAARLTGDNRYAVRAIREMRKAARLADWNPSHFLDVGEMASALAIGYDWLYDFLDDTDRKEIAQALKDKALRPSFDSLPERLWWVSGTNNWNQVCHGGLTLAAIAVADLYPDLARETLERALENLPKAAHGYAPDGAYAEGPIYWDYGTTFHVLLAAALEQLGEGSHGVDKFPGFARSAEYIREMTSPSGDFYSYSDSEKRRPMAVALFWFARRFGKPDVVQYELDHLDAVLDAYEKTMHDDACRFLALALIWHAPVSGHAQEKQLPLRWFARGPNPVAVFRTAWDDPNAMFAGIKGGCARDPHAHMDAGSFILEADGVRWALDLDKQDYGDLERAGIALWDVDQGGDRWKVFRHGSAGHNILRFNGADQRVDGRANWIRVETDGSMPYAIVDLDPVYQGQVEKVARGLAFLNRGVLIQDEWATGEHDVEAEWQMLTQAQVIVNQQTLLLLQKGRQLTLHLIGPEPVHIEVRDASKPARPYDAPNPGVSQIRLSLRTAAHSNGMFRVLAVPGSASTPRHFPPLTPLSEWKSKTSSAPVWIL